MLFSVRPLLATAALFCIFVLEATGATSRFAPITTYPSGGAAQYSATADVNGDGKLDVFASNTNGVISILLGNGNGSFQAPKTIATLSAGSYPILTADLNGDKKPDLVVLEPGNAKVLIYLGVGNGTFESPLSFSAGNSPAYMALGDANGDGKLDLIISSYNSSASGFSLLLGEGNGSFHAPTFIASKNGAAGGVLAVGDVNNDGHLDVVTCDEQGDAEVFLGNGKGTFQELAEFQDGNPANFGDENQLLLADLYGKGNLDLVVGGFGYQEPGSISLLEGKGDGTFAAPKFLYAGFNPVWIEAADMNDDGKADLVVANEFSNSVTVLLNHGGGTFVPSSLHNAATADLDPDDSPGILADPTPGLLSVGDFNGDGKPDVALASAPGIDVLPNLGGGVLYAPASIETGQLTSQTFSADFNGDGQADLAFISTSFANPLAPGSSLNILFGNGKGDFPAEADLGVDAEDDASFSPLAGGFFNGNGKLGLASFGEATGGIVQLYNSGKGQFTSGNTLYLQDQPTYLCAGDFNGDGYSDFAVLDGNDVDIYLNLKNGAYSGPVSYKLGSNPSYILKADLNGDGYVDLVATNNGSNEVSVLLGTGKGTFEPARSYPAGDSPNVVTIGDFNKDGKIDLAVGGNQVAILLGVGDGSFKAPTTFAAHGPVTFLTQTDLRSNGIEDLVAVSTDSTGQTVPYDIYVLSGKGNGSFAAPVAYAAGADPYWLATGDFNDDGAQDLAVTTYDGSAITLLLNQGGTRVTLTASATSVKEGQPVTFTATVAASIPGSGKPTGSVVFEDGSKTIGTVTLTGGKAVSAAIKLAKGTHSISASYEGDGSFNPHTSAAISVSVNAE